VPGITDESILFIADLHLDPQRYASYQLALQYLHDARQAQALYILGDLFEYWLGDDIGLDLYRPVIDALNQVSNAGCSITVMHGNRDFLLSNEFASACGLQLITADELLIDLDGQHTLIMHGDTLCSDDIAYQQFRSQVRSNEWQTQFLAMNKSERIERATAMRESSKAASVHKSQTIMDINDQLAAERMRMHNCHTLIHGHTHRPAVHAMSSGASVNDSSAQTTQSGSRYVVGDWHDSYAQVVHYNDGELQLLRYST